jgi:hypothetical protein
MNVGMRSFYKRFVRDFMRYNDGIQCAGDELIRNIRQDVRDLGIVSGDYYALHIRRGDLQYKDMKPSTPEILHNLHFPNGTAIIPSGSVVYISTDDPSGTCKNCFDHGKACELYPMDETRPIGCPKDVRMLVLPWYFLKL